MSRARRACAAIAIAAATAVHLGTSVAPAGARTRARPAAARRARPPRPPVDLVAKARTLLGTHVPPAWLAAVPVGISLVPGRTSLSYRGRIEFGAATLAGRNAAFVTVHEWGHQLAVRYGTGAWFGAPPAGFPYAGPHPEEVFADAVAQALTGVSLATDGTYPRPAPEQVAWAGAFLAAGPDAYAPRPAPTPAPAAAPVPPAPLPVPPPLLPLKVGSF